MELWELSEVVHQKKTIKHVFVYYFLFLLF